MDNREKILETALELFGEMTYEAVGVQQIALSAGITKPTLYHYFGSKKGLMEALLKEKGGAYLAATRRAAGYKGDVMAALKGVASAQLQFAGQNETFYRLLRAMSSMPRGCDSFHMADPYAIEEYGILEELFRQIAQDHGNIGSRYRVYAATFMGMMHTYIDLYLRGVQLAEEELLHRVVHQFMHGIFS